ncbi:MAG: hypothetical protein PVG14_09390 [Anaerolineales bacterium]|jgi:uncharacterized membrane protein
MTEEPTTPEVTPEVSPEITSDDKLWSALGYPIPLIAIIVLLLEEKKARPFIKYHAVQSIALNVVLYILMIILGITVVGAICAPLIWLVTLWPAFDSYNGNYTEIPVITDFIKNQDWV